ncbi:MAG TPA: ABC transporter permease [Gemmatimonadales bacterium]
MRRVLHLAWVEVLHLVRDRASLAQLLLVPFIQLVILANAATFAIRDTPFALVDLDGTPASRALARHFLASPHFRPISGASTVPAADRAMLAGRATMVLVIPRGFDEALERGEGAFVQVQLNAEKGSAAGIVQTYAQRIVRRFGEERLAASPAGRLRPAIAVTTRGWYNAELDYRQYMVPGILVALVTLVGTLFTAQNIAREKELGTLEQLNVTPISKRAFIGAKLLPFWVLGMVELLLGLWIGAAVFGMPMRGSLLLLMAIAAVYLVAALGAGLLISTIVETQQQAMFVTFFVMMIYLLMSGLYTPVDSMPGWVRVVAEANPVKHFVEITRAILLKGAGPGDIVKPAAMLAMFAVGFGGMAVGRYRKGER